MSLPLLFPQVVAPPASTPFPHTHDAYDEDFYMFHYKVRGVCWQSGGITSYLPPQHVTAFVVSTMFRLLPFAIDALCCCLLCILGIYVVG